MAHRYLDDALEATTVGATITVSGPEARHAVTVSRIAVGEQITIGNGAGLVVTGTVAVADPTALAITVAAVDVAPPRNPSVFLAQALAKGDRDELAIQAATELGVDGVIPWSAARSVSRWEGAKVAKGRERWRSVVREASKQSLRAWLPDVLDLVTTRELARLAGETRMLLLEPTAPTALSEFLAQPHDSTRDLILVVGPEGGIAPQERELLTTAGAVPIRLGVEVLRTSTAGPAALAALNGWLGRW